MNGIAESRECIAPFYRWTFPGAPIRVHLDLDLVDALRNELGTPAAQPVTGGLLIGQVQDAAVHVDRHVPLGELTESKLQIAVETIIADLDDRTIVGFYRSQHGEPLTLTDQDVRLGTRFFADRHSVILAVQPDKTSATFFFWDESRLVGDFAFLEFPLDREALSRDSAGGDPSTDELFERAGEKSSADETAAGPHPISISAKALIWAASLSVLLLLMTLAVSLIAFRARPATPSKETPPADRQPLVSAVGLQAERSGSDFRMVWDRHSAVIQSAVSGSLSIQDGPNKREIALQASDLRTGSVLYQPTSDKMQVQMSVVGPDQRIITESIFVLLSARVPLVQRVVPTAPRPIERGRDVRASHDDASTSPPVMQAPPASVAVSQLPLSQIGSAMPVLLPPSEDPATSQQLVAENSVSPERAEERSPQRVPAAATLEKTRRAEPELKPVESVVRRVDPPPGQAGIPVQPRPSVRGPAYVPPIPLKQVVPPSSPLLRSLIQHPGKVEVRVLIDEKGAVTDAILVSRAGVDSLYVVGEALRAARMWRYKPALRDARVIKSDSIVEFQFKP